MTPPVGGPFPSPVVAAVVPAAGLGERLGPGAPKALRDLAGEPLLVHAVRGLRASGRVDAVVVVVPAGEEQYVTGLLAPYDVVVVTGGATRQDSVAAGLAALEDSVTHVLVHDAARCLTPVEVIDRVVDALLAGADAVVPVLPMVDTVKRVEGESVVATVERADLRAAQTPQGFRRSVLVEAHAGAPSLTDDVGLVERAGGTVVVVAGSEEAFKVTRPLDLLLAEALLASRT